MSVHPFAFGSETLPGLAKLSEESGEVVQIIGKLMMTGGRFDHWSGDLEPKLVEEIGDLSAALIFVTRHAGLDQAAIVERTKSKLDLFEKWHQEQSQRAVHQSPAAEVTA